MRRLVPILIGALLAVAVIAPAAFAAPAPAQASTPTAPIAQLQATLHDDPQSGPIMLVSARVADGVRLPATIALPIPSGAQVIWAGETLGGDVSKDPERPYTIEKRDGYDLALITLQKATDGQIEVAMPTAVTVNGAAKSVLVKLPVPYDVAQASIAVRVPSTSQVTTTSPGLQKQAGPTGFSYFTMNEQAAKAGSVLQASLGYTAGAAANATATTGQSNGAPTWVLWLIALVAVGGGVLFVRSLSGKMAEKSGSAAASPRASRSSGGGSDFFEDEPEREAMPQAAAAKPKKPAPKPAVETPARKVSPTFIIVGVVAAIVIGIAAFSGSLENKAVQGGQSAVEGGVQKFTVDTSTGQFNPSEIVAKAGIPIEITFGPGTG